MPTLNDDLPAHLYLKCRKEAFYDLRDHEGELADVVAFAVSSVPGEALGFHVLTESGAVFARVPIHLLRWKADPAPARPLADLQIWDCFGHDLAAIRYRYLAGLRGTAFLGDAREPAGCGYLLTVDWYGNGFSDEPAQAKCAHVVALDDGHLAALPNNRLLWRDPSFTVADPARPDFLTNTRRWSAEAGRRPE